MIKGVLLGISASVFIISLVVFFSGLSGQLAPNIITGSVIGEKEFMAYGIIFLILSFILGLSVVVKMINE